MPGQVPDRTHWKIQGNVTRDAQLFRAVLEGEDRAEFEREFRQALTRVSEDFDTSHIDHVLNRWWGHAGMTAQPITDDERDAIERADRGDPSKFWTLDTDQTFWKRDENGDLWRSDENGTYRETESGLRTDD
ncbi:hypothetical protein SAMN04487905_101363 [Actinopolyspora xinjiangensis]|uniref:Uncharacterized protein n=1 Tax=Actinopolyspora xinjiangensis TaxID=405564 RepID=A0A1H0P315_9ACTN|nr:DUF6247 family protein [Actinopolyspora xinjiangensis]SDO99229.1 hypothetical protein SAMN04487905_101363 [Actinopolyspora xinjiangensis]